MNSAIRWRIVTLQAIMVVVLAAASGFALYIGNFTTNQIHEELVGQQISFPTTTALAADPRSSEYPQDFKQYAGQALDTGDKARAYANGYLGVHLNETAGGLTYSTIGGKISELNGYIAKTPTTDPNYKNLQNEVAILQGQRTTLFQGETLRSMLLNAYGWWTIGTYTTYAGYGLMLAALVVLGALMFEVFAAARRPETIKVTPKTAASAAA